MSRVPFPSANHGPVNSDSSLNLPNSGRTTNSPSNYSHEDLVASTPRRKSFMNQFGWILLLLPLAIIGLGVGLGLGLNKKSKSVAIISDPSSTTDSTPTSTSSSPNPTSTTRSNESKNLATGSDQSTVYVEDGTCFIYNNTFGGFWVDIPFNDTAQAQSFTPPLNQPWDYNVNRIKGVNLGGWFVIEPFITPALFEPFSTDATVIDEWTLSIALGDKMASTIENHYATFITEKDFAEIAAAGLNWVRIPIGYWILETYPGEPFLAKVGWKYFLQALVWARKYGLRVNLDLHAVPGSQNGYNHSSKYGSVNFLNGLMGLANAQRTLNYIRTLAEFISQPEYKNLVQMFSILNEPDASSIGLTNLRSFYLEAYTLIRSITGIGAGNGPMITFSDRIGGDQWIGFLSGADRIMMDEHPYLIFGPAHDYALPYSASVVCSSWAQGFNSTRASIPYLAGEWSLAVNDCGQFLNNVGNGARFDGTWTNPNVAGDKPLSLLPGVGSCGTWNHYPNWTADRLTGLSMVGDANMDAFSDWFFWTWKTGASSVAPYLIANPMWNYQLALANGFITKDPRTASGSCQTISRAQGGTVPAPVIPPPYSAAALGGAGAGNILPAQLALYTPYPPAQIGNPALPSNTLPSFTKTAPIIIAPAGPSPTIFPIGYGNMNVSIGNGWTNSKDNDLFYAPIRGCTYPDAWNGVGIDSPARCNGA